MSYRYPLFALCLFFLVACGGEQDNASDTEDDPGSEEESGSSEAASEEEESDEEEPTPRKIEIRSEEETPTPAPESTAAPASTPPPAAEPGLTPAEMKPVFRANQRRVRACYERELKRNEGLRGKVTMKLKIAPSGAVVSAHAIANSTGNKDLSACIAKKVKAWTFPKAPRSTTVTKSFPFEPDVF